MPVRAPSPYVSKKQPPTPILIYASIFGAAIHVSINALVLSRERYITIFFNYNIMNKTEFIDAVSAKAGLSKADGKKAVDAMVETILSEMEKGEKVSILGFGSFSVVEKAARKGVNPRTKEAIEIPARKVIKFKPGAELVSSVS
jgi:putative uncharacterized protein (fragment)